MLKKKLLNVAIYKVSPVAQRDLIDIYVRGFREWGERKLEEYQLKYYKHDPAIICLANLMNVSNKQETGGRLI